MWLLKFWLPHVYLGWLRASIMLVQRLNVIWSMSFHIGAQPINVRNCYSTYVKRIKCISSNMIRICKLYTSEQLEEVPGKGIKDQYPLPTLRTFLSPRTSSSYRRSSYGVRKAVTDDEGWLVQHVAARKDILTMQCTQHYRVPARRSLVETSLSQEKKMDKPSRSASAINRLCGASHHESEHEQKYEERTRNRGIGEAGRAKAPGRIFGRRCPGPGRGERVWWPRLAKAALSPRSDPRDGNYPPHTFASPRNLAGLFHLITRSRAASGRDRAAGSDLVARGREKEETTRWWRVACKASCSLASPDNVPRSAPNRHVFCCSWSSRKFVQNVDLYGSDSIFRIWQDNTALGFFHCR
jgi:hypothetical protein